MTTPDFEKKVDQDWGDEWDNLPPAPPLFFAQPRKSAQVTLRVPAEMVTTLKGVARRKTLAYHSLARSWIAEGLRERMVPSGSDELSAIGLPGDVQLNLKVNPELLNELKMFSDEIRVPYHRLVRLWIESALKRELALTVSNTSVKPPSLRELMILLLDAPGPGGSNRAVRGITRLQKLLFIIEKRLAADPSRFYAYNYGPFDEQVNDAADALQVKGLLGGSPKVTSDRPTAQDMLASVLRHAGPADNAQAFELTDEGRNAAAKLKKSNAAYRQLAKSIGTLRVEWDRPDLIERVYEAFPEYTGQSLIKDEVTRRRSLRGGPTR